MIGAWVSTNHQYYITFCGHWEDFSLSLNEMALKETKGMNWVGLARGTSATINPNPLTHLNCMKGGWGWGQDETDRGRGWLTNFYHYSNASLQYGASSSDEASHFGNASKVCCYNCNEFGHMSRNRLKDKKTPIIATTDTLDTLDT